MVNNQRYMIKRQEDNIVELVALKSTLEKSQPLKKRIRNPENTNFNWSNLVPKVPTN